MQRPTTTAGELQVASDVLEVTRRLRRLVRRHLREVAPDVPPPQMEVLQVVAETPGVGVGEVAATLCLAPNTVSTLVKALAASALVQRAPSEHDRRSCRLTLTDQGEALVATWRDRRSEVVATAIALLAPADQRNLASCVPLLRRLTRAVDKV